MADIMDYWNGAGYGQIPEEQSLYGQTGGYQSPTPWANANTQAPNFQSPGLSYSDGTGMFSDSAKNPLLYMGLGNPFSKDLWSFDNWGLGKRKKVQAPNVTWPSYQGTAFTPAEGLPKYYNPSQETTNQTQQQLYAQQQAQSGQQSNDLMASLQNALSSQGQQGYDYNYGGGQPQYVGQQEQAYGSFYGGQNKGLNQTFNPSNPYGM